MTDALPALPGAADPGDGNAQALLVREVERLLQPLLDAAGDDWQLDALLDALGWDLTALPGTGADLTDWLEHVTAAVGDITGLLEDPPDSLEDLGRVLSATSAAFSAVRGLPPALAALDAEALARDLMDHLVIAYLVRHHPVLHQVLVLLGVVVTAEDADPEPGLIVDGVPLRRPRARSRVYPERLVDLVSDPVGTLRARYLPNGLATEADADTLADLLLPRLGALLHALGVTALIGVPDLDDDTDLDANSIALGRRMLTLSHKVGGASLGAELGLTLALASEETGGLGVVLVPSGAVAVDQLLGRWGLHVDLSAAGPGLAVGPRGVTLSDDALGHVGLRAELRTVRDGHPALRLGSAEGTRLEIGAVRVWLAAELDATAEDGPTPTPAELLDRADLEIGAAAEKAALVVAPGDGDGFLASVLPAEGLRAEFDSGLVWSRRKGLHVHGSAGLAAELPVHFRLGPLEVQGIQLGLTAGEDGLRAVVTGTARLALGPVTATVERMGLSAGLSPAPGRDGNLGALSLGAGFEPPRGASLSIAAGPVTGGGHLFFDPDQEQYAGALALQLQGIALKAVGLLTTRMPGGEDGFSLLVIVSTEFTPVQLGFGFTLNGVGGLIGVNRSVNVDALRAGLRTGALDSVLFPKDPLGRAAELVGTLGAVFPATPGRHVVGPMARIGWGTPTLLTIDVGLLLELPAPLRLALLGRLHLALPTEEEAVVVVNVDILGTIDFDRARAAVDASLRDSRIAGFALTGDLAMRADWGEKPAFAISAGGFHPRFQPPADFPQLRRLALSLLNGDNPRIRLEAYVALTSNTVQFGARLELYAAALGFSVQGMLSFDALVQFEPFGFAVDMAGSFALKRGRTNIMAVRVDVALSGPRPWHARGRARFEILFFSGEISFDRTFGSSAPPAELPAAVEVVALLEAALADPRNWTAQLPGAGNSVVTLREIPHEEGVLPAHPLGSLAVTQRVVPLDVTLDRYGQAPVSGPDRLTITAVTVRGAPDADAEPLVTTETREYFAPAQFRELGDDEKLARPSFEELPAGRTAARAKGPGRDRGGLVQAEVDYEEVLVDGAAGAAPAALRAAALAAPAAPGSGVLAGPALSSRTAASPAARAAARRSGKARFAASARRLRVHDTGYAVDGATAAAARGPAAASTTAPRPAATTWTEADELRRTLLRDAAPRPGAVQAVAHPSTDPATAALRIIAVPGGDR
ncbi:DUF6603 domain-containing protein [Streptomyces macrosporus]|uniref:DUF6603 domain-containing protein n=1 Tax=Streptomyces macrosporus TaxID=44032 RepID=A0ABP5XUQ9_9ACTN